MEVWHEERKREIKSVCLYNESKGLLYLRRSTTGDNELRSGLTEGVNLRRRVSEIKAVTARGSKWKSAVMGGGGDFIKKCM